jgi:hypothetical protein
LLDARDVTLLFESLDVDAQCLLRDRHALGQISLWWEGRASQIDPVAQQLNDDIELGRADF